MSHPYKVPRTPRRESPSWWLIAALWVPILGMCGFSLWEIFKAMV